MTNDDDEYYSRWGKSFDSKTITTNPTQGDRKKKIGYPSAPEPSPLLKEYMASKGIPVS